MNAYCPYEMLFIGNAVERFVYTSQECDLVSENEFGKSLADSVQGLYEELVEAESYVATHMNDTASADVERTVLAVIEKFTRLHPHVFGLFLLYLVT